MPKVRPGDKAPDFTLKDLQGRAFRLHDSLGGQKTLLVFFRGEWSPVCNRYLTGLQQQAARFRESHTQLIALSCDSLAAAWNLQNRLGLSFRILPGLTREIIDAYDLFYNENDGHSEPAIFILHPDGTVAFEAIVSGNLGRPNVDDLLTIASRI